MKQESSKYYMRKFHLRYMLPDGHEYRGMINVIADTKEQLPTSKEIKGSFWAEREEKGWKGHFSFENYPTPVNNLVYPRGVYVPDDKIYSSEFIRSAQQANELLTFVSELDMTGQAVPRFTGRIEDCIYAEETHCFDKTNSAEKNFKITKKSIDFDR